MPITRTAVSPWSGTTYIGTAATDGLVNQQRRCTQRLRVKVVQIVTNVKCLQNIPRSLFNDFRNYVLYCFKVTGGHVLLNKRLFFALSDMLPLRSNARSSQPVFPSSLSITFLPKNIFLAWARTLILTVELDLQTSRWNNYLSCRLVFLFYP